MVIVEINSCNFGSTGNIMLNIAEVARKHGHAVYTACPDGRSMWRKKLEAHIYIGSRLSRNVHLKLSYLIGYNDCFSFFSTKKFLRRLDALQPDIIHLHNLHNCYINLRLLFRWIKKNNINVVWTLHDCWTFTGQCPHFTMIKCKKWKTGCHCCPQYRLYPQTLLDRTRMMWKLKRKWFTGVDNLTIVTPSHWLARLVKESYLMNYPVKVIHNGIDLSVYMPAKGDLRDRLNLKKKFVLLGVASAWGERKGLDVFVKLAQRLDERFQIILVGTNEELDKQISPNIISIHRTHNQQELAKLYTMADVFVNPTREEVLGMVNIESLACGTPVITYATGGSPECIDETCGVVVPCDDIEALTKAIEFVCINKPFPHEACIERARAFDMRDKYGEYLALYGLVFHTERE